MADIADVAQREIEREDERRARRIEDRRIRIEVSKKRRHECEACGDTLEPHRIDYGICFDCKSEQEIREKRIAK